MLLTALIIMFGILVIWILALPIGIYSATRQYSIPDYIFTLLGFIGMSVPLFLVALVLMYLVNTWFGVSASGLFSPEYSGKVWSWARFADLMQHIWLPVLVLGHGGTAGMIRVMRGNLLDELRKPYVTTARANGVRSPKLLFKYPVRLALNPFISTIVGIFPTPVSGGAIVAIVLSLPTVGPQLLTSLMTEDMYFGGSMLMALSLLGIFGTPGLRPAPSVAGSKDPNGRRNPMIASDHWQGGRRQCHWCLPDTSGRASMASMARATGCHVSIGNDSDGNQ